MKAVAQVRVVKQSGLCKHGPQHPKRKRTVRGCCSLPQTRSVFLDTTVVVIVIIVVKANSPPMYVVHPVIQVAWHYGLAPFRVYDCGRPGNDAERSQLIRSATPEVAVLMKVHLQRPLSARPSLSARPASQQALRPPSTHIHLFTTLGEAQR